MKIAFLLSDITNIGGIERVTTMLASSFAQHKELQIEIVSLFHGRNEINYPLQECIKITYLSDTSNARRPHSMMRIFKLLTLRTALKRHLQNNKYDYIIAQAFPLVFLLSTCCQRLDNVYAVEHVHCRYYNSIIRHIRNKIYTRVKNIIVLTDKDKAFFDQYFPTNKTIKISNPCDVNDIYNSKLENKVIISVGRLEYQKGYDTLIDVFRMVNMRYPDWQLKIYGDGTLRHDLQAQITKLKLNDTVELCGTTNDIKSCLRGASIFVASSRFEGFHMGLVEAMSQGVPCISFDCPNGPSDIIVHGKNGLLVENQDTQALHDALIYLIERPDKRRAMGKCALESVNRFSTATIARKWIGLLKTSKLNYV